MDTKARRKYKTEWQKQWAKDHPKEETARDRAYYLRHRDEIRKKQNDYHKKRRDTLRNMVIEGYGGKCACCGVSEKVFLAIDHVNGNGNQERRAKKCRGNDKFLVRIICTGFPPEYQILCHNCNWAKHRGVCPHQK